MTRFRKGQRAVFRNAVDPRHLSEECVLIERRKSGIWRVAFDDGADTWVLPSELTVIKSKPRVGKSR